MLCLCVAMPLYATLRYAMLLPCHRCSALCPSCARPHDATAALGYATPLLRYDTLSLALASLFCATPSLCLTTQCLCPAAPCSAWLYLCLAGLNLTVLPRLQNGRMRHCATDPNPGNGRNPTTLAKQSQTRRPILQP